MKTLIITAVIVLILIALSYMAWGEEISDERIVNAIFKAEGGYKATYLYGIRSVKYADEKEARQICFNSVRNNKKRWIKAGKPEDFITFMSRRYCPVGCDNDPNNLNVNWVKNVRYYLDFSR